MNGLQAYQASQNAFATSAEEINNNISMFRGKTLSTIEANKSLLEQAKSATDLETLKGLGEEFAVRAFSEYGQKLTKMVDDKLTGGRILGDTEGLKTGIYNKLGELKERVDTYFDGEPQEEEYEGKELTEMESKDGTEMESKDGAEGVEEEGGNDLDFNNFLENFNSSIGIQPEEQDEGLQRYEGKEADTGYEAPEYEGEEVAGNTAVESGVGDALEATGGLLDATGVGALVGVPLEVGGALLEGGALYEAGKGIVDFVKQDILGDKPNVNTTALPSAKPTLAQQGLVSAPIWDSSMDMPSSSGAF